MKQFQTSAAKKADKDRRTETFELDGVVLTARAPKNNALIGLATVYTGTPIQQVAATIRFVQHCMVPASWDHLQARLDDDADPFDYDETTDEDGNVSSGMVPIMEWLVEEFIGDPTSPSSRPSRKSGTGGKPSKGPARSRA